MAEINPSDSSPLPDRAGTILFELCRGVLRLGTDEKGVRDASIGIQANSKAGVDSPATVDITLKEIGLHRVLPEVATVPVTV